MKKLLFILFIILTTSVAYAQNVKISQMPGATTPLTGSELVPLVQNSNNVQTKVSNFISLGVNVIGHYSMLECDPNWPSESETTAGVSLQNCLLTAQTLALSQGAARQANLGRDGCIQFDLFGASPNLKTEIVVPRYVCLVPYNVLVRDGTGTLSSNWTGNPNAGNLGNSQEPFIIFPPTGQLKGTLITHLNSNGSDGGSGVFYGRTWRVMGITIASGGIGFNGGESCTVANGDSLGPATGATFTVATASGGAAASLTYSPSRWATQTGQYYLPPYLQAQQWAISNGWNGSDTYHPQVFDTNGNYKTTCSGGGSGLTVQLTWWPDWCDGTNGCTLSTTYDGAFGNFSPSTGIMTDIVAVQSANKISTNYGRTFGVYVDGFDVELGRIQTGESSWGLYLSGSDVRVDWHNDVGSAIQYKMRGGSVHLTNGIWDTPVDTVNSDAHAAEIDACSNCSVDFFSAFHNSNSAATVGNQQVRLGTDLTISSSSSQNNGLTMNGQFYSDGSSPQSTFAAYECAYTLDSKLSGVVSNLNAAGTARSSQYNVIIQTSTNCGNSVTLTGSIDNIPVNSIYSGTVNTGFQVFDAAKQVYEGATQTTWGSRNGPAFAWSNAAGSARNYLLASGVSLGSGPQLAAVSTGSGADTSVALNLTSTGNGNINLYTELGTSRQAAVKDTASAVNYLTFSGAPTGLSPTVGSAGSDTNVGLILDSQGTSPVLIEIGTSTQAEVVNTNNSTDYLTFTGAVTGNPTSVVIGAAGIDTNVGIALVPAGTAGISIGTTVSAGQLTLKNASTHAGQAACWTTSGAIGYCTSVVSSGGGCTCVGL